MVRSVADSGRLSVSRLFSAAATRSWNSFAVPNPGGTLRVSSAEAGMVPFARTKAERLANGDPRLSLEERYGTHDGYVAAVKAAAADAMARGFLLQADADDLIAQAASSHVLNP